MSGLIGDILRQARALAAQGKGLEIAGRNLANVNTPGYARQRVLLGDRGSIRTPLGTESMGVEALGVQQMRDRFLDRSVTREISQSGTLGALVNYLQRAQASLGEQIDRSSDPTAIDGTASHGNGVTDALNDFFNASSALSANPTDVSAKQSLLQQAQVLVGRFNQVDGRLSSLQSDINGEIDGNVKTVNGLLSDIARLNGQIGSAEAGAPGTAVDLRDTRQSKLEELAQYMNFETRPIGETGQIQLIARDGSNAEVVLVDKANALGSITFDGTNFSGGTPATTLALQSGALPGAVSARDGAIQTLRDNLATVATQLTTAVNSAYNPTGTGTNFFQVPPGAGLIALDPSLTVATLRTTATGNPGANEIALAVTALATHSFSTASGDGINGTLGGYLTGAVTNLGQSLSTAQDNADSQATVEQMLRSQRDSVSGVSMDEEMADLMTFQRAYQASAHVINVVDQLLEQVVTGLGH